MRQIKKDFLNYIVKNGDFTFLTIHSEIGSYYIDNNKDENIFYVYLIKKSNYKLFLIGKYNKKHFINFINFINVIDIESITF